MTFAELLTAARYWLRDDVSATSHVNDSLPDALGLLWFNEAIDEACRRSPLIIDSATEVICTIALMAGTASYARDGRIVKIKRAELAGRDSKLIKYSSCDLDRERPGWKSLTGNVEGYITDLSTSAIRFFRVPESAGTVTLTVQRTQLTPLSATTSVPEIPSRYHSKLVPYVVAKVRDIDDTELYDPRKAAKAMAVFDAEFGPPRGAWNETYEDAMPEYEDID